MAGTAEKVDYHLNPLPRRFSACLCMRSGRGFLSNVLRGDWRLRLLRSPADEDNSGWILALHGRIHSWIGRRLATRLIRLARPLSTLGMFASWFGVALSE